jgi:response regulator NasT
MSGAPRDPPRLRVLIADENLDALAQTAARLRELGHEVVGREIQADELVEAVESEHPDLAVVRVEDDEAHALELVQRLTEIAPCPVVAVLTEEDPDFVRRSADLGLLAYASPDRLASLQSAIELAQRRFADMARLSGQIADLSEALERRAVIERAKGVLMERHGVEEAEAYDLLRGQARRRRQKLSDVAQVVLDARELLPGSRGPQPPPEE